MHAFYAKPSQVNPLICLSNPQNQSINKSDIFHCSQRPDCALNRIPEYFLDKCQFLFSVLSGVCRTMVQGWITKRGTRSDVYVRVYSLYCGAPGTKPSNRSIIFISFHDNTFNPLDQILYMQDLDLRLEDKHPLV